MSAWDSPEPDTRPVEVQLCEGFEAMQRAWEHEAQLEPRVIVLPQGVIDKLFERPAAKSLGCPAMTVSLIVVLVILALALGLTVHLGFLGLLLIAALLLLAL